MPEKGARIESIDWQGERLSADRVAMCKISCPVEYLQEVVEAKGSIVKAVAQHSDMFSLGAIIYFIATGGKNPELFWSRCAALAQHPFRFAERRSLEEPSTFHTCQSFALALCDDGGSFYKDDRKRFLSNKNLGLAYTTGKPTKPKGMLSLLGSSSAISESSIPLPDSENDPFASGLATQTSIKMLIEDMNGARISLPVMIVILRCMLRGKPDSFVRPSAEEAEKPVSLWDLHQRAKECADQCLKFVTYPSCDARLDSWLALGAREDNVLLTLRILDSKNDRAASASAAGGSVSLASPNSADKTKVT